jgi:hypothetical protein
VDDPRRRPPRGIRSPRRGRPSEPTPGGGHDLSHRPVPGADARPVPRAVPAAGPGPRPRTASRTAARTAATRPGRATAHLTRRSPPLDVSLVVPGRQSRLVARLRTARELLHSRSSARRSPGPLTHRLGGPRGRFPQPITPMLRLDPDVPPSWSRMCCHCACTGPIGCGSSAVLGSARGLAAGSGLGQQIGCGTSPASSSGAVSHTRSSGCGTDIGCVRFTAGPRRGVPTADRRPPHTDRLWEARWLWEAAYTYASPALAARQPGAHPPGERHRAPRPRARARARGAAGVIDIGPYLRSATASPRVSAADLTDERPGRQG